MECYFVPKELFQGGQDSTEVECDGNQRSYFCAD